MTKKQRILNTLTKPRLIEIAKEFEMSGLTGYNKEELVIELSRRRSFPIDVILELLMRDELKDICYELGLDETGTAKSTLAYRIIAYLAPSTAVPLKNEKQAVKNKKEKKPMSSSSQKEEMRNEYWPEPEKKSVTRPDYWGPDNPHPLSKMRTEIVWEGKYDEWGNRREVEIASFSMPMQKIETIDQPKWEATAAGQGDLFENQTTRKDDFRNRLIWGDNRLIMASLLQSYKGQVDLVYIDPPFDVGADFTLDVNIGEGKKSYQKDQSTLEMVAYRDIWGKGADSYLQMLYDRLVLIRKLLSESGTVYVHVGRNVSHLVRSLCDDVFSPANYKNEITWKRSHAHGDTGQGATHFGPVTEAILVYTKTENPIWHPQHKPYTEEIINRDYKYFDEKTGERYRLMPVDGPGGAAKGNPFYEFLGVSGYWRYSKKTMQDLYEAGEIVLSSTGKSLSRKRDLRDAKGTPITDLWDDVNRISPTSSERIGYATQKPECLLERIVSSSSDKDSIVADFFCGSGSLGAIAERLGRRWIMADLGRFAIHTSRKRLIELQRELSNQQKAYRAFDVYNLGRYERQWWQEESLKGADEEHRAVVLEFFRAETINPNSAISPLLHGRKGSAFCHVDSIDSIFTRDEAREVAEASAKAGSRECYCLAWEFEMDLTLTTAALEREYGVKLKLIQIPREIMEKNRKPPPPFLEMALVEAEPVLRKIGGETQKRVDIKLTKFMPSLAEVTSKELEALKERAIKSGMDFIDFWAIDFDWRPDKPFNHHWQDYRTRKDRTLKTVSDAGFLYSEPGTYTACVKVVDTFGCDTSITVEIENE